jgi:hypothetical protein
MMEVMVWSTHHWGPRGLLWLWRDPSVHLLRTQYHLCWPQREHKEKTLLMGSKNTPEDGISVTTITGL